MIIGSLYPLTSPIFLLSIALVKDFTLFGLLFFSLLKRVLEFCCSDASNSSASPAIESSSQATVTSASSGTNLQWQDDVDGNEQLKLGFVCRFPLPKNNHIKDIMQTHQAIAEVSLAMMLPFF